MNQMNDIHDIRPPVFVGFDPGITDILLIGVGVIFIIFLIWFLFRLYKNRAFFNKNKNTLLLPPPLPAEDIAAKELETIVDLMKEDRRLFYFKLTAILKKYINRRFNLNAQEMTSPELIKSINTLDIKSEFLLKTSSFLNFSDSIKYAAMPASLQEVENDFNLIKVFIKITSETTDEYPDNSLKEETS